MKRLILVAATALALTPAAAFAAQTRASDGKAPPASQPNFTCDVGGVIMTDLSPREGHFWERLGFDCVKS